MDTAEGAVFGEPEVAGERRGQAGAALAVTVGSLAVGERCWETSAAFEAVFGGLRDCGAGWWEGFVATEAVGGWALAVGQEQRQTGVASGAVFERRDDRGAGRRKAVAAIGA